MVKVNGSNSPKVPSSADAPMEFDVWEEAGRSAIGSPATHMTAAQVKETIMSAQRQLQAAGFYRGAIDGKFGGGSNAAVEKFIARAIKDQEIPADAANADMPNKLNWLRFVAQNHFEVPQAVKETPIIAGLKEPDAAKRHVPTGVGEDKAIKQMSTRELIDTLDLGTNEKFRGAVGQVRDRTSGADVADPDPHARFIPEAEVLKHLKMAVELQRRLAAAPVTSYNSSFPSQLEIGGMVTEAYYYAASWYYDQSRAKPAPSDDGEPEAKVKNAAQKATEVYQKMLDTARATARDPANLPGGGTRAFESATIKQIIRSDMQRVPEEIFSTLTADGQTVTQYLAAYKKGQSKDTDPKTVGDSREAQSEALLQGASEARVMPSKAQIAAALFPKSVRGSNVKEVRELAVNAAYELQRYEYLVGDDKAFKKALFGDQKLLEDKTDSPKSPAKKSLFDDNLALAANYFGMSHPVTEESALAQVKDESQATRGYLLDNIYALIDLQGRLSSGEAPTAADKALMKDVAEQVLSLRKTPPGYLQVANHYRSQKTADPVADSETK